MKESSHGFRSAAAGFLIGIGCVLPGVSGGVMAMSFGLYRPLLDAALHFFREPLRKLRFLLPIGIGGALGMMLGAKLLTVLMAEHEALMLFTYQPSSLCLCICISKRVVLSPRFSSVQASLAAR